MTDLDDLDFPGDPGIQPLPPPPGTYERIARRARRRRLTKLAVVNAALLAVIALVGTQRLVDLAGPPPDPPIATQAPQPPPPAPTPASTPTPSPTSPIKTTPVNATTAATGRCHTQDLRVAVGAAADSGGAGTAYENLVFTNRSGKDCTLYGYPGVSFVAGDQGTQVNRGFTRTGDPKHTITLAPAGVAHAEIALAQVLNFGSDCKPVEVRGFRVYPPDETASIFVSQPQQACSADNVGVGEVAPVIAGQ